MIENLPESVGEKHKYKPKPELSNITGRYSFQQYVCTSNR